jgi:hypothetical protein
MVVIRSNTCLDAQICLLSRVSFGLNPGRPAEDSEYRLRATVRSNTTTTQSTQRRHSDSRHRSWPPCGRGGATRPGRTAALGRVGTSPPPPSLAPLLAARAARCHAPRARAAPGRVGLTVCSPLLRGPAGHSRSTPGSGSLHGATRWCWIAGAYHHREPGASRCG